MTSCKPLVHLTACLLLCALLELPTVAARCDTTPPQLPFRLRHRRAAEQAGLTLDMIQQVTTVHSKSGLPHQWYWECEPTCVYHGVTANDWCDPKKYVCSGRDETTDKKGKVLRSSGHAWEQLAELSLAIHSGGCHPKCPVTCVHTGALAPPAPPYPPEPPIGNLTDSLLDDPDESELPDAGVATTQGAPLASAEATSDSTPGGYEQSQGRYVPAASYRQQQAENAPADRYGQQAGYAPTDRYGQQAAPAGYGQQEAGYAPTDRYGQQAAPAGYGQQEAGYAPTDRYGQQAAPAGYGQQEAGYAPTDRYGQQASTPYWEGGPPSATYEGTGVGAPFTSYGQEGRYAGETATPPDGEYQGISSVLDEPAIGDEPAGETGAAADEYEGEKDQASQSEGEGYEGIKSVLDEPEIEDLPAKEDAAPAGEYEVGKDQAAEKEGEGYQGISSVLDEAEIEDTPANQYGEEKSEPAEIVEVDTGRSRRHGKSRVRHARTSAQEGDELLEEEEDAPASEAAPEAPSDEGSVSELGLNTTEYSTASTDTFARQWDTNSTGVAADLTGTDFANNFSGVWAEESDRPANLTSANSTSWEQEGAYTTEGTEGAYGNSTTWEDSAYRNDTAWEQGTDGNATSWEAGSDSSSTAGDSSPTGNFTDYGSDAPDVNGTLTGDAMWSNGTETLSNEEPAAGSTTSAGEAADADSSSTLSINATDAAAFEEEGSGLILNATTGALPNGTDVNVWDSNSTSTEVEATNPTDGEAWSSTEGSLEVNGTAWDEAGANSTGVVILETNSTGDAAVDSATAWNGTAVDVETNSTGEYSEEGTASEAEKAQPAGGEAEEEPEEEEPAVAVTGHAKKKYVAAKKAPTHSHTSHTSKRSADAEPDSSEESAPVEDSSDNEVPTEGTTKASAKKKAKKAAGEEAEGTTGTSAEEDDEATGSTEESTEQPAGETAEGATEEPAGETKAEPTQQQAEETTEETTEKATEGTTEEPAGEATEDSTATSEGTTQTSEDAPASGKGSKAAHKKTKKAHASAPAPVDMAKVREAFAGKPSESSEFFKPFSDEEMEAADKLSNYDGVDVADIQSSEVLHQPHDPSELLRQTIEAEAAGHGAEGSVPSSLGSSPSAKPGKSHKHSKAAPAPAEPGEADSHEAKKKISWGKSSKKGRKGKLPKLKKKAGGKVKIPVQQPSQGAEEQGESEGGRAGGHATAMGGRRAGPPSAGRSAHAYEGVSTHAGARSRAHARPPSLGARARMAAAHRASETQG